MENLTFSEANQSDLAWINEKYDSIGFKTSKLEDETIILARVEGKRAAVGRLVRIDTETAELGGMYVLPEYRKNKIAGHLVQELIQRGQHFKRIFCLPFSHLENFYKRFGFRNLNSDDAMQVPKEISEKLNWCACTYKDPTSILIR